MFQVSKRCYCAFCRSPRTVYAKKHVSAVDVGLALLGSGLLSLIFWQDIDPRALIFFALGLGVAEIFIVIRWRLSIACPRCGFDPVLYRRSSDRAVERVKTHMREMRESPLSAFMAAPRLPVKKTQAKPREPSPAGASSVVSAPSPTAPHAPR